MKNSCAKKPEVFYNNILFCTDFSDNADYAFHFALASVMRSNDAALHILHVLPEPDAQFWKTYLYEIDDVDTKATEDIHLKISESYLKDITDNRKVTIAVVKGRADEEILSYAKKTGADLLVLGRRGTSPVRLNIFGNVAEVVVRKAECPVLIIPHNHLQSAGVIAPE